MSKIKVIDYLISSLNKIGINDFFGLPGDYNFNIVRSIELNEKTNWIGCTNELNAGYAADGYARINGYGALVTTYGVGELSAINAIAGSFAENIPVIKIVGTPSTVDIKNNTLLHHNFINPNYYAFEKAYSNVCETTAYLNRDNAKKEIDRVINIFVKYKRPVYIAIPIDICLLDIEEEKAYIEIKSDPKTLQQAVQNALKLIENSKNPILLVDVLVKRFFAVDNLKKFINKINIPVANLLMGKGIIDESQENYLGTYLGSKDNLTTYNLINNSDCVISIGTIYNDLNTFKFDIAFEANNFINIQGTYTIIKNKKYDNVLMNDILYELEKNITKRNIVLKKEKYEYEYKRIQEEKENKYLTCDFIFSKLQEFIRENDIIFAETGIIQFGIARLKFANKMELNNQFLWGSIGWATAATFGACIAIQNIMPKKRIILITGDGSHQLTCQEISSIMRYNLNPIIIILNNSGYTIERILSEDPNGKYNDIATWNYSLLPKVFKGNYYSCQAKTKDELIKVLEKINTEQKNKLCYIELFTDKMDMPYLVRKIYNV